MSDRAAQATIGRDYCRGCAGPSKQTFAGWATGDGHENTIRPRAFYRQCVKCATMRLVLGNVNDAEGLCRNVLQGWLSHRVAHGAGVGATGTARGDGNLDADDALSFLQGALWSVYTEWKPELSPSFLAYASALLPLTLAGWSRDATGDAVAGRRKLPKAHAPSVSVSYDQLTEGTGIEGSGSDELYRQVDDRDALGGLGGFTADHAETLSPDLFRALTAGGGREARDRGLDGKQAARGTAAPS